MTRKKKRLEHYDTQVKNLVSRATRSTLVTLFGKLIETLNFHEQNEDGKITVIEKPYL